MFRHKSLGLLTGMLVAPRLVSKIMSRSPGKLPGSSTLEDIASKVSHYGISSTTPDEIPLTHTLYTLHQDSTPS